MILFFPTEKLKKKRPTLAHVWEPVKILFVKKSFVCAQFACQVAFDGLNWILRRQRDAQKKMAVVNVPLFFLAFTLAVNGVDVLEMQDHRCRIQFACDLIAGCDPAEHHRAVSSS